MTTSITSAECDYCGKLVRIRQDGTVRVHHFTQRGQKVECQDSGKPYAFHMGTFRVVQRDENRKATLWLVECRCGESSTGPDHDTVIAWHEQHSDAARSAA